MPTHLTDTLLKSYLTNTLTPCLFLDIDGTLAPFTLAPTDSKIPDNTLIRLKKLQCLGVFIAIITGRSLGEARQMLTRLPFPEWVNVPIGATHGLEIALTADSAPVLAYFVTDELPLIVAKIEAQCKSLKGEGVLLEKKPYSVALHYRQNPALADTAWQMMQTTADNFPNWQLKPGKFVWEIMPKGVDKGQAVTTILSHVKQRFNQSHTPPLNPLNLSLFPIFIGDDVSDEAGFLAVQAAGGMGIKVGEPQPNVSDNPSHANFYVKDIDEVAQILDLIYHRYHLKQNTNPSVNLPFSPQLSQRYEPCYRVIQSGKNA